MFGDLAARLTSPAASTPATASAPTIGSRVGVLARLPAERGQQRQRRRAAQPNKDDDDRPGRLAAR
jgi:hypothetical protein